MRPAELVVKEPLKTFLTYKMMACGFHGLREAALVHVYAFSPCTLTWADDKLSTVLYVHHLECH